MPRSEFPVKVRNDYRHLDPDHERGDPREQTEGQTRGCDQFGEIGEVSQQHRCRKTLRCDIACKLVDWDVEHLLCSVGHEHGAGAEAYEGIGITRERPIKAPKTWDQEFALGSALSCIWYPLLW